MNIKSNFKNLENAQLRLELEISADSLNEEYQNLIKKYSNSVSIPGFRKGKVPSSFIEKRFNENISKEVIEEVIPKAIEKTIKDNNIKIIGPATLEDENQSLNYEKGQPLKVNLIFNRQPQCTIKSFDNLSIVKKKYDLQPTDIAESKKKFLDSMGKMHSIENNFPQDGDTINLEISFTDSNLSSLNLKDYKFVFSQHGKEIKPDYLQFLIKEIATLKKGEGKTFNCNFDDKVENELIKSQSVEITVKINTIERFQSATITEELLKEIQMKDESELDNKIETELTNYLKDKVTEESYLTAINELKKNTDFEIPKIAADYYLQNQWDGMVKQMEMRGQEKVEKAPPQKWFEENRPMAMEKIKEELLIDKVRETENIQIGEKEMEEEINKMAEQAKIEVKEYRKQIIKSGTYSHLKNQLINKKTFDWILSKCTIQSEEVIPFKELENKNLKTN